MKKLIDLLEEFYLESIEKDFRKKLKLVEDFGHLISEKSIPSDIQISEKDYQIKYRGNINEIFHLSVRKFFSIKILIKDEFGQESLFEKDLVLKGKYHLKNIGYGNVEILSSSPYAKFGNTIRKFSKAEDIILLDSEYKDFSLNRFLEL